ncbi:hypothetical protein MKW98_015814 [Papaver atlanticum]|uniref:Uncharacterized protein n=1 Tax=Papaver atlanticum TaxID=357466 RepID=A0AAD4TE92_9MAGN|nr:hypothetical protein MKW98_015814 [Papaver atlanticum]
MRVFVNSEVLQVTGFSVGGCVIDDYGERIYKGKVVQDEIFTRFTIKVPCWKIAMNKLLACKIPSHHPLLLA